MLLPHMVFVLLSHYARHAPTPPWSSCSSTTMVFMLLSPTVDFSLCLNIINRTFRTFYLNRKDWLFYLLFVPGGNVIKWTVTLISSVQFSCSVVSNSVTPWSAACQGSLSITDSWSLHKLTSIKSVMPYSDLILCQSGSWRSFFRAYFIGVGVESGEPHAQGKAKPHGQVFAP